MATTHINRGNLIIKDENLGVNMQKKDGVNGKGKNVITAKKKGGGGLGSRKALNDITNKSVIRQEVATKRNNAAKEEEFNVKDEMFLHDHKKCEEAQRKVGISCFLETVLPGIELDLLEKSKKSQQVEAVPVPESPPCYPEPMEEPVPELFDSMDTLNGWNSLSTSLLTQDWDSPPSSPLPWLFEPVEFTLIPENEV